MTWIRKLVDALVPLDKVSILITKSIREDLKLPVPCLLKLSNIQMPGQVKHNVNSSHINVVYEGYNGVLYLCFTEALEGCVHARLTL